MSLLASGFPGTFFLRTRDFIGSPIMIYAPRLFLFRRGAARHGRFVIRSRDSGLKLGQQAREISFAVIDVLQPVHAVAPEVREVGLVPARFMHARREAGEDAEAALQD